MTEAWLVVVVVGVVTVSIKAVGPVLLGGRELPAAIGGVMRLLAPAVLAALVVVQVVGRDGDVVLDERLLGVAAATVALLLRAPMVVVVVAAAATTALTRLWLV
jgi:branched-subunit amino acid transport protein